MKWCRGYGDVCGQNWWSVGFGLLVELVKLWLANWGGSGRL